MYVAEGTQAYQRLIFTKTSFQQFQQTDSSTKTNQRRRSLSIWMKLMSNKLFLFFYNHLVFNVKLLNSKQIGCHRIKLF